MHVPPSWGLQNSNFFRRSNCEHASAPGQKLLFSIVASLRCSGEKSRIGNAKAVLFHTCWPGSRSLFNTVPYGFGIRWKQAAQLFCLSELMSWLWGCLGKKSWDLNAGAEETRTISTSLPKGSFDFSHIPVWMEWACDKTVLLVTSYIDIDI